MIKKTRMTPREKKELEMLQIENEKYKSQLDYVAMMTDVEIPGGEEEINEQEV